MPMIAMGVGAGVSALGSYLGGKSAAKESAAARAQAADFTNKAIVALEKVGIPSVEAQRIALETPQMVFNYVPELEKEFPELKTAFEDITNDPRLVIAQAEALKGIEERATGTGFTPDEMAAINQARNATKQQAAARDATIAQQAEQRGVGGSGLEFLLRQGSSQQALEQAARDSENQIQLTAQRKLEALAQLGNLAGQQQQQSYQQASDLASNRDIMSKLNQGMQYDVQQRNVASKNQAALAKQELAQDLENQRAATSNQEQMYNKQLQQQKFENEMAKAGAAASAYTGAGQQALQAGQTAAANKQAMWQGIGQAAMGGAQLYGAASKGSSSNTTQDEPYSAYDKLTASYRS